MRRPVRHKSRLSVLISGSPLRPATSRPNISASRLPARRYTEAQTNRWCDRAREWGLEVGKEEATEGAIGVLLDRFLDGDPDLMTRKELGDVAYLLIKLAGAVTEMRYRIPIEPYVLAQMSEKERDWYARTHDDSDIDLPLDDE